MAGAEQLQPLSQFVWLGQSLLGCGKAPGVAGVPAGPEATALVLRVASLPFAPSYRPSAGSRHRGEHRNTKQVVIPGDLLQHAGSAPRNNSQHLERQGGVCREKQGRWLGEYPYVIGQGHRSFGPGRVSGPVPMPATPQSRLDLSVVEVGQSDCRWG